MKTPTMVYKVWKKRKSVSYPDIETEWDQLVATCSTSSAALEHVEVNEWFKITYESVRST